ncbi:MAG: tRNA 4-thiouridine(8) synthase ThiI [Candidatus Diapherotrites archaeon]|nr:tRNA 4-thiouridine(8) synthase ThiI [Candidatus Diapherotrites archaeon]
MKRVKALALVSGGLDSLIAVKLVQAEGIDVTAVTFKNPFHQGDYIAIIKKNLSQTGTPLIIIELDKEYLQVITHPKYGYGSGMNPCVDCRVFLLKKAWELAKSINAKFLVTGEVVGQRPMSQQKHQLELIEKETGLKGKILRPLSAKLLPPTEAEKQGWVNRKNLLDISGRSRKKQLELARAYGIKEYLTPAGGCLLTEKEFSGRLRDMLERGGKLTRRVVELLKIGRHFRIEETKIIVGRNEEENKKLLILKDPDDYVFEVPNAGSPITLLQGPKTEEAIQLAASLTARYSDAKGATVMVKYGKDFENELTTGRLEDAEKFRI